MIDDSDLDLDLKFNIGINDEILTALREWLTDCWEKGEYPNYDQIGKFIYDYTNN